MTTFNLQLEDKIYKIDLYPEVRVAITRHNQFVKDGINGKTRQRFTAKDKRDNLFSEILSHYNLEPQLKNGVHPYIAILVPSNQKGRNNQGVARIVCTNKFVRGTGNNPVDAFDLDIDWVESYKEQGEVAERFGLKINAFTPKSFR
jgi:hypothetical protein